MKAIIAIIIILSRTKEALDGYHISTKIYKQPN